jgi:hypothetical protein
MLNPSARLALAFDIMETTLADFHERRTSMKGGLQTGPASPGVSNNRIHV